MGLPVSILKLKSVCDMTVIRGLEITRLYFMPGSFHLTLLIFTKVSLVFYLSLIIKQLKVQHH